MIKKNVVKGWITSVIGTITMILTLYLTYTQAIDFIWEGIGGLAIGAILLLAPQTIEKNVKGVINKWTGDTSGSSKNDYIG